MMDTTTLSEQLLNLGLARGDVLYLRASLKPVGISKEELGPSLLRSIFDVVGPEGTLIVPAFVRQYGRWQRNIPVSDKNLRPNTGALSDIVLAHPSAIRSQHPTHSFAGLGPVASEILEGHTAEKSAFEPMRKIVDRDGLMMLVGCVESSPGFSTVHLAQFDLGLTRRHYLRHLTHVRLPDLNGRRQYFNPIESPGCSMSFGKFYGMYDEFRRGKFGEADAVSVRAKAAFALEKRTLSKDPLFVDCGDPYCLHCTARGYNKRAWASFVFKAVPHFLWSGSSSLR
jgi:aminoglycoside N3'-acetyltransferase